MIIGSVSENKEIEKRISITPDIAKKYIDVGFQIFIESKYGSHLGISDDEFLKLGCKIEKKENILKQSDIILQLNFLEEDCLEYIKENCILIGNFNSNQNLEKIAKFKSNKNSIFSLELLPRITRAQSMDILSSQANLAGYKAVVDSFAEFKRAIPMMMTAAGTISAAKVLVVGAGVAGLQAIATAKRMGAIVFATDVRTASKEQVESLGGKFLSVEGSENLETEGGYAKETSDDYKKKQQELLAEHISKADIVITTALIPGRPAPILIPEDMVKGMKPGSVVMDLAAENGGNCELTNPGEVSTKHGVIIDGTTNIPGTMSVHATELYAKNVNALLTHIYNKDELTLNTEDEITEGSMYIYNGEITDERTKEALS